MADEQLLERISCSSNVMTGKPVIRGTRLTAEYILSPRVHGASEDGILAEYGGLTLEDIQACYGCQQVIGEDGSPAPHIGCGLDALPRGRMHRPGCSSMAAW